VNIAHAPTGLTPETKPQETTRHHPASTTKPLTNHDRKLNGVYMPIVHVYLWSGASKEAKTKIIKGITRVFEDLGIPAQAVQVVIHEVPKENWGTGGEPASEKFKETKTP
jgi:4-oxalocrotonate tautomerase